MSKAKEWEAARKRDEAAQQGKSAQEVSELPSEATALAEDINALLGGREGKEASEATIRTLSAADKYFQGPPDATSKYNPLVMDISNLPK